MLVFLIGRYTGSWLLQLGSLVCSKTFGCQVYVVSSIIAESNDTKVEDMQLILLLCSRRRQLKLQRTIWDGTE